MRMGYVSYLFFAVNIRYYFTSLQWTVYCMFNETMHAPSTTSFTLRSSACLVANTGIITTNNSSNQNTALHITHAPALTYTSPCKPLCRRANCPPIHLHKHSYLKLFKTVLDSTYSKVGESKDLATTESNKMQQSSFNNYISCYAVTPQRAWHCNMTATKPSKQTCSNPCSTRCSGAPQAKEPASTATMLPLIHQQKQIFCNNPGYWS